jgi:glycosyltransferase involved in cell wall biosynthesis
MYKDIAEWGVDPLFHFLQWGLLERRRPRLQSEVVDIDWYAGPLPSNRHLKYTALSGPFAHLAIITPAPLSEPLRGAIESCVGLDPKLDRAIASSAALPIRALPDCRPRFSFARSLLLDPLATSDLWILSSWLARGGAERVIANIANSFVEQFGPGRVTVVVTDFDRAEVLDWFSHGVNVILLPDLYPRAGPEEICLMLRQAIIFARPQTVLNVNSVTGWRLFEQYGRPLSRLTRFMAAFFCNDYDSNGTPVGYFADYFDDTFEIVSTYITDHATFLGGMFERKNLGPAFDERVHVLYQPVVLPTAKATASSRAKSRTVLWVGRYSAQKRPELAIRIAELAPSLHFDLYGPDFPPDFRLPTNATLKGAVANFGEVPVEKYKYFMHTAAWDGLPNVLLEACSSGLPIVAPAIGGIPELVNDKTGWLIRDCHNPEAYSQALQSMDRNPREVSKRLKAMRAVVSKRHSTGTFNSKICTIFGD